jgi:hypothetical protein
MIEAIVGSMIQGHYSKQAAKRQMSFQDRMSSTAYQRAMEDMRKAGLNPILAGKLGGASTPPGAKADTPNFGQNLNTARQISNMWKLQKSQIDTQSATQEKLRAEASYASAKAQQVEEQNLHNYGTYTANKLLAETRYIKQNMDYLKQNISEKKIKNTLAAFRSNWERNVYKAPMQTLTARALNYILSSALSGMDEKTRNNIIHNVNRGIGFLNNKLNYYLDNPQELEKLIGKASTAILIGALVEVFTGNRSMPDFFNNDKPRNKPKGNKGGKNYNFRFPKKIPIPGLKF